MKKRILSLLLALLMVLGIFPASALATDSTGETTAETTSETNILNDEELKTPCITCAVVDCLSDHTNWCDTCKKDDCGKEHKTCATCGTVDCTADHTNWCDICKKDDCGKEHKTCATCGTMDCTADHANWCETCRKDSCGVDHGTSAEIEVCETCQQEACTCESEEEISGPVCDKNCGADTVGAHNDLCAVKEYYKDLFINSTPEQLYNIWAELSADAQDYILNNISWNDQTKRAALVELINAGTVEKKCGCCGDCTGDETCACQCEGCTCKSEEPDSECGCCENCIGEEGCECECEDCTFCPGQIPECSCYSAEDIQHHASDCALYLSWVKLYAEDLSVEEISTQWTSLDKNTRESILAILSDNAPEKLEELKALLPDMTVTKNDDAAGVAVAVTGEIPEDVTLNTASVSEDKYNEDIYNFIPNVQAVRFALDITLRNPDNTIWQPYSGESVMVTLDAVALGMVEGERVRLIHDHEGDVEDLGVFSVVDGLLTFPMKRFSTIYVASVTAVYQNAVNNVVYFDLNAGNVVITGNTYSGFRFDGGKDALEVTGTLEDGQSYYVYQSNSENKAQTGLIQKEGTEEPVYEMRLPNRIRVNGWAGFIKSNTNLDGDDGIIATWNVRAAEAGRTTTPNTITVSGNTQISMVIDNVWSSYQQPSGAGERTAALKYDPAGSGSLELKFKGDTRFAKIYYHATQAQGAKIIFAGDADSTVTVANLAQNANNNYWKAAIGSDDGSDGSSAGITINNGNIFAGTNTKDDCTAIGGGGNGYGGITINGGIVTAVTSSSGTAIGGGIGKTHVGGQADIVINGGEVYAYNFSCEDGGYSNTGVDYIPAAAIGGGSSAQATCKTSTVTITGGYVFARSVGGTAIGGGSSADNHGGSSEIEIRGGTIDVASMAGTIGGQAVKAGAAIGGGTGGTKGNGGNCTLTISGNPTIYTGSIGGGKTISTTGHTIGAATVKIAGGTLQGQVIMAKGAASNCSFEMTGGTIDNSAALAGILNADNDLEFTNRGSGQFHTYTFLEDNGGAVYVENGVASLSGGTIQNVSAVNGGAFYVTGGTLNTTGGTIRSFTATENGGAVCVMDGGASIGGDITGSGEKTEAQKGGAVYVGGGTFTMTGGTTKDCNASVMGGAVCVEEVGDTTGTAIINNGTITNVYAPKGGAIAVTGSETESGGETESDSTETVTGGSFTMNGGTISAVKATSDGTEIDGLGGAVYVKNGHAKVTGGDIIGDANTAEAGSGGGVYVEGGTFTMTGGTMTNFNVTGNGGMVCVTGEGAKATIQGGTITGNDAVDEARNGGAIYISAGGEFTINGEGHIVSCNATGSGGGVYLDDGTFKVEGGSFENCAAANDGGGVYLGAGMFSMPGGSFVSCSAGQNGGAVCIMGGTANINGGSIQGDNTVVENAITAVNTREAVNGGGIYVGGGKLEMKSGTITGCSATYGGAAYITGGECNMQGGMVSYNHATDGGAMYVVNTPVVYGNEEGLNNIVVEWNQAVENGGGMFIHNVNESTSITNGRINHNYAGNFGGGIYHTGEGGSCAVSGAGQIAGNRAVNGGGLYIIGGSTLTVSGGHITENEARGTPDATVTTAYNHNDNVGVGGGVYLGPGTTINSSGFTMEKGKAAGIYGNTAGFAADDLYADINATVLSLPTIKGMSLGGGATATGWYCDYAAGDTEYLNNTLLVPSQFPGVITHKSIERYRTAASYTDTSPYKVNVTNEDDENKIIVFRDKYVCLTIGKDVINFGQIIISKDGTVAEDQYFVFRVTATDLQNKALDLFEFDVTVKGSGSVTIDKVPFGTYTVEELESWSWRYEVAESATQTIELEEKHKTVTVSFVNQIDKDVAYDKTQNSSLWLDGNSANKVNIWNQPQTAVQSALNFLGSLFQGKEGEA